MQSTHWTSWYYSAELCEPIVLPTLTDKNSWHYPVLMNLEGIPVTMTIFMIVTVLENSCWFEKCNQQIRLRLMFFPYLP